LEQEFDFKEQEESNIIKGILERYLPFWPLIIFTTLISFSAAYLYIRYTPKVYRSEGKILVKDDKKGVDASKVLEALDVFGEKKIVENEIEILKSWPLMEAVVKKLNLYATVRFEGRIVDRELYKDDAPIKVVALQPDIISEIKEIPFKVDFKKNIIIINEIAYSSGQSIKIGESYYKITLNRKKRFDDRQQFFLSLKPVHLVAKSIVSGLEIESTAKQSTLIAVSLKISHPVKAQHIINTLFEEYQIASLKDKNLAASNTLTFIEDRLNLVIQELDSVENDIENYKSATGILDISEQSRFFLESLKKDDEQLNQLNIQLALLKDIENYVNGRGLKPGTVPSLMGINDATLVGLLTKLYDTELLYQRQEKVNGAKSDVLEQLRGDLNHLRKDILEILINIRRSLLTSKSKIEIEQAKSQNLIAKVPEKEKRLIQISRQQAIKNSIYTFLLQKREETAISYKSSVTDSRLIEPAVSNNNPISPVTRVVWLVALGVGIFLFVLIVFIIEQANNKVLFRKEIEKSTKAPIIGELLQSDTKESAIIVQHGSRSLIAEQFKIIRTNLSYYATKNQSQTILVTSSISGEGKSFIAINMAISYALLGKKVALLELDLRKPKVAQQLGIKSKFGITHYLTNHAIVEDIIQTLPEYPELYIFPSGPIPPNPSELISSSKFADLFNHLKECFDYIIIDSPPVGLVTDAQLLGGFADTTLYIVRHHYTPKVYLEMINNLFSNQRLPSLSIVFNGIKPRGINLYGPYGYGAKYGYGSSYGSPYNAGYYTDSNTPKSLFKSFLKKA
jgi:capsular exopolysaccharide synthesis family protein